MRSHYATLNVIPLNGMHRNTQHRVETTVRFVALQSKLDFSDVIIQSVEHHLEFVLLAHFLLFLSFPENPISFPSCSLSLFLFPSYSHTHTHTHTLHLGWQHARGYTCAPWKIQLYALLSGRGERETER